jgi:site-specific DNA-methyltransferase (adenine-specific)
VVADPELNDQFADECCRLGLMGNPRIWNTLLFRLRKAAKLIEFPTTRPTLLAWEGCDDFLFASEIALELMLQQGPASSLDEILCDPALAREFDQKAAAFAPEFSPLQYRWAALKLRKQANSARCRGSALDVPARLSPAIPVDDLARIELLPDEPGIYLVTADQNESLYVGQTVSLRKRACANFGEPHLLQPWIAHSGAGFLSVEHFATGQSSMHMLGFQSRMACKYNPRLNFRELRLAQ